MGITLEEKGDLGDPQEAVSDKDECDSSLETEENQEENPINYYIEIKELSERSDMDYFLGCSELNRHVCSSSVTGTKTLTGKEKYILHVSIATGFIGTCLDTEAEMSTGGLKTVPCVP